MTTAAWESECGSLVLILQVTDAHCGAHAGRCDDDIAGLRGIPYIHEQLAMLHATALVRELRSYGAWSEVDLSDHDANLSRVLWLACCHIKDNTQ